MRRPVRWPAGWLPAALVLSAAIWGCHREPEGDDARFEEVAAPSGIRFITASGSSPDLHPYEVIGGGAAWLDFDGDGRLDLFLVGRGGSALYRNLGPGSGPAAGPGFEDVTAGSGIATSGWGMGVAVGDHDGDGDPDLFVPGFGGDLLFRNEGGGRFTEVGRAAGVAGPPAGSAAGSAAGAPGRPRWSAGAAFADFDGDGDLDLFVATYFDYDPADPSRPRCSADDLSGRRRGIYCGPAAFDGAGDLLYLNRGDGTFEDSSVRAGVMAGGPARSKSMGVLATDLDGDGEVDLYVAGDAVVNALYLGRGDGTFRDKSYVSGAGLGDRGQAEGGMGVEAGDQDGDGVIDLFVTNYTGEPNRLYRGLGGGRFEDATAASGAGLGTRHLVGWGCGLRDFDSDGDLDLLFANGHIHLDVERWALPAQTFEQPLRYYGNVSGRFADASAAAGKAFEVRWSWRGIAFGDYDDDGDVDAAVVSTGGPAALLRNETGSRRSWATVRLVGGKPRSPTAVGARVELRAGGRRWVRWVSAGGSYLSESDPRLHFGLGGAGAIDAIEVRWPGGRVETLGPAPTRRHLTIEEGKGLNYGQPPEN